MIKNAAVILAHIRRFYGIALDICYTVSADQFLASYTVLVVFKSETTSTGCWSWPRIVFARTMAGHVGETSTRYQGVPSELLVHSNDNI